MELSKGQKLRNKIEELKSETGLDDESIQKLFVKEYLLKDENDTEVDPDRSFSDFIHKKDKETVEVDVDEMIKDREEEAKETKREWNDRAYKKQGQ